MLNYQRVIPQNLPENSGLPQATQTRSLGDQLSRGLEDLEVEAQKRGDLAFGAGRSEEKLVVSAPGYARMKNLA